VSERSRGFGELLSANCGSSHKIRPTQRRNQTRKFFFTNVCVDNNFLLIDGISFILKVSVLIGAAGSATWKTNTATLQSLMRKLCGKNQQMFRCNEELLRLLLHRDEVWTDDEPYTLAKVAADLESWSGFQNLCRDKGEAAGREVLQEFISKYFKC
jgi:hypothetical protein